MWLKEVEVYLTDKEPIILLVGNKVDKVSQSSSIKIHSLFSLVFSYFSQAERQVSRDEGAKFAKKHSMLFIEASAKTKLGIQQAFEGDFPPFFTIQILTFARTCTEDFRHADIVPAARKGESDG